MIFEFSLIYLFYTSIQNLLKTEIKTVAFYQILLMCVYMILAKITFFRYVIQNCGLTEIPDYKSLAGSNCRY